MRRSRSESPAPSSPPSTSRQRRRRSSRAAEIASGMALDPQNLEQQRQRLLEARAGDPDTGRHRRRGTALADLREEAPALDHPEAAEGSPQDRKKLNEILFARLAQPVIDQLPERVILQDHLGARSQEPLEPLPRSEEHTSEL